MRLVLALVLLASVVPRARAQDRDADRVPDAVDLCPDSARAIGFVVVRSAGGMEARAWSGIATSPFDRAAVRTALAERQDAIDARHGPALRAAGIAGRITVRMTIQTTGETTDVGLTSDGFAPAHPEVGACLVRLVDALTIATPPTRGAVVVSYGFAFEVEP
jgi:hypothetical protein